MTEPLGEKPLLEEPPYLEHDLPRWWERLLGSFDCACLAFVIGVALFILTNGVSEHFKPQLGWGGLGLLLLPFVETLFAGVIALFAGALYPGKIGMFATLVAHSVGSLALSALMLLDAPGFRIYSPFFFAAAVLLGVIATITLRVKTASPMEDFPEKTQSTKPEDPLDD